MVEWPSHEHDIARTPEGVLVSRVLNEVDPAYLERKLRPKGLRGTVAEVATSTYTSAASRRRLSLLIHWLDGPAVAAAALRALHAAPEGERRPFISGLRTGRPKRPTGSSLLLVVRGTQRNAPVGWKRWDASGIRRRTRC